MKPLLLFAEALLFAIAKREGITWYIDGDNLLGQRGTARDSKAAARKLREIQGAEAVVFVLDGKKEIATSSQEGILEIVSLAEGISADDYIVQEVHSASGLRKRIQVVTADRELRWRVLAAKPIVRRVVNPVTFWRRYLPRLCGWKKRKRREF